MQMVVELKPSGGGEGKTMDGRVVLNKGTDEAISVTLGKAAYQKTMDLTIHDGRLKNDKNYTLTAQIGKEASEGGTAPDVVTYSSQKASGYQIKTGKVSWYTPLSGVVPVSVQVQEEADIQQHTHRCGGGGGQADHGQAGVGLDAHKVSEGETDAEGLDQSLEHNPEGFVVAVEVADHAE